MDTWSLSSQSMLATLVCAGGDEAPAELATGVGGGEADLPGGGSGAAAAAELRTSSRIAAAFAPES